MDAEQRLSYAMKRYNMLKSQGLCPGCGKERDGRGDFAHKPPAAQKPRRLGRFMCKVGRGIICRPCLDRIKAQNASRRQRGLFSKKEKWRRDGLCGECGKTRVDRKRFCQGCLDRAKRRYYGRKNAGLCVSCGVAPDHQSGRCQKCRELYKDRCRVRNRAMKIECMEAYGGCKCACCGESHLDFLSIDHLNGGGRQHLLKHRAKGDCRNLYSILKSEGFPAGYQVLCMNCNWAKGKFDLCPHQRDRLSGAHGPVQDSAKSPPQ
jgi:hypothetical protein